MLFFMNKKCNHYNVNFKLIFKIALAIIYIYEMNMKIKNSKTPILSIVTVCFNDYDALIKTFNSVKKQNFTNYEYLVIDGGSKDDTVKFLKKNNEIIDYWVSENDNGIYDAFNKGIIKSKGKYIDFVVLNSIGNAEVKSILIDKILDE